MAASVGDDGEAGVVPWKVIRQRGNRHDHPTAMPALLLPSPAPPGATQQSTGLCRPLEVDLSVMTFAVVSPRLIGCHVLSHLFHGGKVLAELADLAAAGAGRYLGNVAKPGNLIHDLAHLFTVRACWLQGRQHCQLEGLAVGGALVG
jgi:hypothetical protein